MILFIKQLEPKKGKLNRKMSLYAFLFLSGIIVFLSCYSVQVNIKTSLINSQGYIRFRLFWKYAEIGYFG